MLLLKIISFIIIFSSFLNSFAQERIVTSTGTSMVDFPDYKSRIEVEKEAEELAIINALERAFGRLVIQGNSTFIKNVNTGEQTKTFSSFNMIGNTYVKGEVLEIIEKDFNEKKGIKKMDKQEKEYKELECIIKIKARELSEVPVSMTAYPLKTANKFSKITEYHVGDTLYFYFSSEENGYLSIFFDDNNYSYCLLPYKNVPDQYKAGIPVESGKEYILFSSKYNKQYFKDLVPYQDTYVLTTNEMFEMDRLFIIFSKQPINKPVYKDNIDENIINEIQKKQGYTLPDALKSEDFQHWLMKNRSIRKDIQVKYVDITVSKFN